MRAAPFSFALALPLAVSTLHAKASECGAYSGDAVRVCSAAVDATRAFHPLLGVLSTDFEDFDTTKGKFFAGLGPRVGF
jgi:hypothetical protein